MALLYRLYPNYWFDGRLPYSYSGERPRKEADSVPSRGPHPIQSVGCDRTCRCWQVLLSGWWFGTFFIFPYYMGNNDPKWLIFFQRGWNHQPGCSFWGAHLEGYWGFLGKSAQKCDVTECPAGIFLAIISRYPASMPKHIFCRILEPHFSRELHLW